MKNIGLILLIIGLLTTSCNNPKNKDLIQSIDNDEWLIVGNIDVKDNILVLDGITRSIMEGANYKDFELSMELRTISGGKGFVGIHTDDSGKGYRIIINNNREDMVWWRMTGSLASVRNLTKSFVKDNEWFKMNIRVEGQRIVVRVNEELVVDYIEPAEPYRNEMNANTLISEGALSLVTTGNGSIEISKMSIEPINSRDIHITDQLGATQNEQEDNIIRLHQEDFPVLDYHVHLKGGLTKEAAAEQSRRTGINYAVAPNCGIGFPITNDEEIFAYLDSMRSQPYILAMQAEGREWVTTLSPKAHSMLW